ncbi:MAG: class A beta-lactamase-related serine hydrolase [Alkalicoccus sp.]|nr:MAG: class A beta-lactamase-related serine hydrolase [Alkalicoccus sp.]
MNTLRMLCICFVVLFVLLSGVNLQPAAASSHSLDTTELEFFLDSVVENQMEERQIPNLTLSVVSGGAVVSVRGYGTADMDEGTAVDPETTLFRIGSTSKLFTWTAVMQLVEEGELDLDTDINEYVDFDIPSRLEHGWNRGELEPITLRHLMSHTPGFEDYMTGTFAISEDNLLPLDKYVREERPARVFPPGEVPAYSNYGTALAGYIVEVVSGMPYAAYVEENIYDSLGMENSSFRQPLPADLAENMSTPYRYMDQEFQEAEFEYMQEPSGSMSSSASDMARFMLAYLQEGELDGERILEEATVNEMFTEQFTVDSRLDGTAHGFIKTTFNGRDVFHHPGGTMLYDTGLYLIPEEDTGFFISHSGGSYLANIEIFQQFMDQYFPGEGITAPEAPADMAERAEAFTGEYQQNRRSFTTVDKFLSLTLGVIHVDTDEEGFLSVTHLGETNQFTEIEPGVYFNLREGRTQDYGGDFRTIVFSTDPLGKTMFLTDGPMSYSKAAWYETFGVIFLSLIASVVFIIGSLAYWGIKTLILKRRGKTVTHTENKGALWARRTAVVQGILTFVFLIQFLMESDADPLYGFPRSAFSPPPAWVQLLDAAVSYGMVLFGLAIAVFSIIAWWKAYWTAAGRIHYTVFAAACLILAWIFYFFQVL